MLANLPERRRRSCRALLLLLLLVQASACAKPGGTAPQGYPAGWPVAALTMPPGSVRCHMPQAAGQGVWEEAGVRCNAGGPGASREWAVYFTNPAPWADLTHHLDTSLRPLGWRYYEHDVSDKRGFVEGDRFYCSPDSKTLARILRMQGVCYLTISVFDASQALTPVFTSAVPIP